MQGSYTRVAAPEDDQRRLTALHWERSFAFEQGKDDFIESIDDVCIHYDGGRVAANGSLVTEISTRGLRKTTQETGLDRKTIREILNGKKVKTSTLAKVVIGLRSKSTRRASSGYGSFASVDSDETPLWLGSGRAKPCRSVP